MDSNNETDFEKIVRCPTCGSDSLYSPKNDSRPFCSKRCKDVDLGAWASEDFRVDANNVEANDLESATPPLQ